MRPFQILALSVQVCFPPVLNRIVQVKQTNYQPNFTRQLHKSFEARDHWDLTAQ